MEIAAKATNVGQQTQNRQLADAAHAGRRTDAATLDQGLEDHHSFVAA